MADWPSEPAPLGYVSWVSDELSKRRLRGSDIRIEQRHRPRLAFSFSCRCGRRFECDLDVGGSIDFAIDAAWPRAHRQCEPPVPASPQPPDGPMRKATISQLRELQRDPFVREAIAAFWSPARRHGEPSVPNVIGAIFPDGAVWRDSSRRDAPPSPIPAYPPGLMPKAAKANWPKR